MNTSPFYLNIMIMIPYKEQDWLPGEGNGGMEQLESGGKVSMLVAVPNPPVIISRSALKAVSYTNKDNTHIYIYILCEVIRT